MSSTLYSDLHAAQMTVPMSVPVPAPMPVTALMAMEATTTNGRAIVAENATQEMMQYWKWSERTRRFHRFRRLARNVGWIALRVRRLHAFVVDKREQQQSDGNRARSDAGATAGTGMGAGAADASRRRGSGAASGRGGTEEDNPLRLLISAAELQ